MKLELDPGGQRHRIVAYGPGYVEVGGQVHRCGVLVSATELLSPWGPVAVAGLLPAHLEPVLAQAPEVVLLGTGEHLTFPRPEQLGPLAGLGIGVEVMDTGAACRSFNFLLGEGRRVVAALMQPGTGTLSPR